MHVLWLWFGWPEGGVWSNLVAAVLWASPAFTGHHLLMRRHHERTTAEQTKELKDHIDARMEGRQQ